MNRIIKNSNVTLGEICQQIMTDYNQQNQRDKSITSGKKGHEREIYKHFRMLLYLCLKNAFETYLRENYQFLREPRLKESLAGNKIVEFNAEIEWQPHLYDSLMQDVTENSMQLAWYTAAHFMNPKQLNLAIGSIKNYVQYISDIGQRSFDTGKRVISQKDYQMMEQYKKISEVFEFVMLFNSNVTNCISDYFADEDDYAEYLSNYVKFALNGKADDTALKVFSCEKVDKMDLYHDGIHPIINKNVVYAQMYGNTKLLKECFQKITKTDIDCYYKKKEKLSEVFRNGQCQSMEDEKKLREFQNIKNHVELTEITTYSEIVNDFMGQLISWAYLRERDLMYFQLGFYYMKLYYGNSIPEQDKLRCLEGEEVHIRDGAVLYQIIAMYTFELPLYKLEGETGKASVQEMISTGGKVKQFYQDYCDDKGEIYEAGLCLFEDVKNDHDDMASFRNYIDHFHYYTHLDRSIMELYSDVYDRFFDYDIKLRKSVSFIFRNILLRYFVIAKTGMSTETRRRYTKKTQYKQRAARLYIRDHKLDSDEFKASKKYEKSEDSSRCEKERKNTKNSQGASHCGTEQKGQKKKNRGAECLLARNDKFLEQLEKILEYRVDSEK